MSNVWTRDQIEVAVKDVDVIAAMERAFVAYSEGRAVVPAVGELTFVTPPGDAHIKYGYIAQDSVFVVKVVTGFYENNRRGLPPHSGLILVFSTVTGLLEALLLDEGYLTNLRTAAAGGVAAKYLAPPVVSRIGICGTGVQARLQLQTLGQLISCRDVIVWGRSAERVKSYAAEMGAKGFCVVVAADPAEVAARSDLIITATPSTNPLFKVEDVRPGTHITAVGSDTPSKNELDPDLLATADLCVVDSVAQCKERGELHHALTTKNFNLSNVVELGDIIASKRHGRTDPRDITVCDLTGVAVQDIEISKAVLDVLGRTSHPKAYY
jgi:ornithine cyclodeaminase